MLYGANNPHGGDIYQEKIILDFSSNTNPFGTPEGVLDAIGGVLSNIHHYPDPYCRDLVKAISSFEGLPSEYVLCGNGAAELIYAYCQAINAKNAVELAPTFAEYSLALEGTGCRVDRYFLDSDNGFELDDGFLDFALSCKPDAIFICNPNNPTGRIVPVRLLERLLELCRRCGARLFLDECFLDLSDDRVSMKGFLQNYPELFILKAFTKSYGMAGVRLGYCLSSDADLLASMSKTVQPWNVSMLAQVAGIAALREGSFLEETRKVVSVERVWLGKELESLGFQVCSSQANYLLFKGKPGLDEALRKRGIAIRNCDNYQGLCSGWYRIAVRLHDQNEQLIAAIAQVCGKE